MEAVLRALEATNGDLSDGARRSKRRSRTCDSTHRTERSRSTIDGRRSCPIYLSRVEKTEQGTWCTDTFRMIHGVDQTYGGSSRWTHPRPIERSRRVGRPLRPVGGSEAESA